MKSIPKNIKRFGLARKLRKLGKSYSEITNILGVPKSTLSSWFSGVDWPRSVMRQVNRRRKEASVLHVARMNELREEARNKRNEGYREEAKVEYNKFSSNRLFISGLSIYWGEGDKSENGRVSVINSDSSLLQVVINFYRKVLEVPDYKIRGAVFVYGDMDKVDALKYWSEKMNLPENQFIKTQLLPSRSRLTKRKVLNGICSVYFSSTKFNIKVREWIRLMASDMRV